MKSADPAAVAAALAGYRLSGCPLALPSNPLDDEAWDALCYHIRHQDLLGCSGRAVAEGALPTTAAQRQAIASLYRKAMISTLQAESNSVAAITVLRDASVKYRAMDGMALAHVAYPDPGWRPFDSVALLVIDRIEAAAALMDAGWRNDHGGTGPDGNDHTDLYGPAGTRLRLHDRLGSGQLEGTVPASWFESSLPFIVGGLTVNALTPELLLLRICFDAAFAIRGRLRACRDICQLLTELSIDVETTRRLSRSCRMEIVVRLALSATSDALALVTPPAAAGCATASDEREGPSTANAGQEAEGADGRARSDVGSPDAKPALGWLRAWSAVS
jgi:hypothetical protein